MADDPRYRAGELGRKLHRLRMSEPFLDEKDPLHKTTKAEVARLAKEIDELRAGGVTVGHRFAAEVAKRAPVEQEETE